MKDVASQGHQIDSPLKTPTTPHPPSLNRQHRKPLHSLIKGKRDRATRRREVLSSHIKSMMQKTRINPEKTNINVDADTGLIISDAHRILRNFSGGKTIFDVAHGETNLHGFAIAHLIQSLFSRHPWLESCYTTNELLEDVAACLPESMMRKTATNDIIPIPSSRVGVTRHDFIGVLRDCNLLPADVGVRSIKPSGTIPSCVYVCNKVCESTHLSQDAICGTDRQDEIIQARFLLYWMTRTLTGYSLSVIGDTFQGRDHSTIINGIMRVDECLRSTPSLHHDLSILTAQMDECVVHDHLHWLHQKGMRRAA